jgi:cysteinyl-tRNA synthetase
MARTRWSARNVTDVDDKINKKAADEALPISDHRALSGGLSPGRGCARRAAANLEPKATEHIGAILEMIGQLVENGSAYAEGHVLFDTQSFADYGQLSGRPLDKMIARPASRSRPTSATRPTSCCGSPPRRTSQSGKAPGARAVRLASNARP